MNKHISEEDRIFIPLFQMKAHLFGSNLERQIPDE
jgi:hypothetical protein